VKGLVRFSRRAVPPASSQGIGMDAGRVMTCFTTLNSNQIATITVNVSGTTPKSRDDNLSLSGIWSAVWTPTDGTQTGRTDAANNVTICSDSNILNCGP